MPRTPRAQRFLVDPLGVTRDPVRRKMSLAARGAYDSLWMESWFEKEPGVLPADDTILAGLAQCTPEQWVTVRDEVANGFVTGRDTWICQAVTVTKNAQDAKRDGWRKRQQRKREKARDMPVMSRGSSSVSHAYGSGSGSSTGSSASEASTVIANAITPSTGVEADPPGTAPTTNGRTPRTPRAPCRDWIESFDAHFWPAYPRHVGKGAALRAWNKLGLSPEASPDPAKFFNRVMDGLDAWKARHSGTEPEFTPHPSTWLNQRRWEDTDR